MDHLLQLPDQLALHLKSLRKAAGVSQAQLAQRLGVSQSRVAAIERDPAAISVRQLMEILQAGWLTIPARIVQAGSPFIFGIAITLGCWRSVAVFVARAERVHGLVDDAGSWAN